MIKLILLIIFAVSFGGVLFILGRKAPVLSTLPKSGRAGFKKYKLISETEEKVKQIISIFFNGKLLHKFLSWLKCRIIKFETWIDGLLHVIRKKAKEQKLNGKK